MIEKTPQQLATDLLLQSEEYSRYSGMYAELIKVQADYFHEHRAEYKSDTATDREFDRTDEGVKMTVIKMKIKALEKSMSAIKTMLRHKEIEVRNLY